MNDKQVRNIVREYMEKMVIEQDIEISPYTPEEEKFLAKFPELKTTSIGIIYSKDVTGVREFLNRSGKDFNLTPNILHSLLKKGTVSIVPYGGYARNEDYTLQLNIPLEDLEGLSSGPAETDQDKAIATEESVESSQELANLLVTEQKKSLKHTKSRVYTGKSRTLKRLPKGYINYLERIIQILGSKLKNEREREQLVADILDNLAHNFGLTPKQVYRSFIYYRSQNRLANIVRESINEQQSISKNELSSSFSKLFRPGYWSTSETNPKVLAQADKFLNQIKSYVEKNPGVTELTFYINAGESRIPNSDAETGTTVGEGDLAKKRAGSLTKYLQDKLKELFPNLRITAATVNTKIGKTKYDEAGKNAFAAYKKAKYDISQLSTDQQQIVNSFLKDQYINVSMRQTGYAIECNSQPIARSYNRGTAPDFLINDRIDVAIKSLQCNAYTIPDRFGVDGQFMPYFVGSTNTQQWGILLGLISVAYPNGKFHQNVKVTYHKLSEYNATDDTALNELLPKITINNISNSNATSETLSEVASILNSKTGLITRAIKGPTKIVSSNLSGYKTYKTLTFDQMISKGKHLFYKYIEGQPNKRWKGTVLPKPSAEQIAILKKEWDTSKANKKPTPEYEKIYNRIDRLYGYEYLNNLLGKKGIPELEVRNERPTFSVSEKTQVIFSAYAPLGGTQFELSPSC